MTAKDRQGMSLLNSPTPVASTSTAHLRPNGARSRHVNESASLRPHLPRRDSDVKGKGKARTTLRAKLLKVDFRRKGWVGEGFRVFGEHCARNQIRTLLIDCFVMTNLFYPALSVYLQKRFPPLHPPSPPSHNTHRIPFSTSASGISSIGRYKKEHPLSLLSTPVLDSFFPYPPPLLPRLTWAGWWGRDTGQLPDEDGWEVVRFEGDYARDEEIRLMRVAWADVGDVLDGDPSEAEKEWIERDHVFLKLLRDGVEGWEKDFPVLGEGCVRQLQPESNTAKPTGPCYLFSPHDHPPEPGVFPFSSLAPHINTTQEESTVPIGWTANAGSFYHSTAIPMRLARSNAGGFTQRWAGLMSRIGGEMGGELFAEAQGPRNGEGDQTGDWLISYRTSDLPRSDELESELKAATMQSQDIPHSPPKLILFLYLLLFSILGRQLSDATKVHSRFGLAFTGIVQLCCSGVMSFSVLVLLGWNGLGYSRHEATLPTYVLPFVIVVVGAENMSTLTKAVFSVPFTHSVPVRIGLGLSKVGSTIAITSFTDLILLGIVYLSINLAPVREFCLFAAVVIITDWFMLHTFFLTVLSIDAQRLELADVLATNGVMQPANAKQKDVTQSAGFSWRRVLRARMAKSGSLILMLFSIGSIYYLTERHRYPNTIPGLYGYTPSQNPSTTLTTASKIASTAFTTTTSTFLTLTPATKLWRSLNPSNTASILLTIPPASILILPRNGHFMSPSDIRKLAVPASRLLLPRLRPLFFFFKVVVLPEGVTAGALYMLLLYLLKDRDLLAAQRNKLGRGEVDGDVGGTAAAEMVEGSLGGKRGVKAYMLPCSHEVDIDLVAASEDGKVVVSVGIDNSVVIWRFTDESGAVGTREIVRGLESIQDESITAITLDKEGRRLAVSSSNRVHLLGIVNDRQTSLISSHNVSLDHRIISMSFEEGGDVTNDPFEATPRASLDGGDIPDISLVCSDGAVLNLDRAGMVTTSIPGGGSPCRVFRLNEGGHISLLVSTKSSSTLYKRDNDRMGWTVFDLESSVDPGLATAATRNGGLICLGYRSGHVEVFDTQGTPIASRLSDLDTKPIKRLAISNPLITRCSTCKTTSNDPHQFIITSTSTTLHVDRLIQRNTTSSFCRCSRKSIDDAKRPSPPRLNAQNHTHPMYSSTSNSPSPHVSPRRSPSLLPPVSNGEFPLSSHGIRRLSNVHGTGTGNGGAGASGTKEEGSPNPNAGMASGSTAMGHSTSTGSTVAEWEIQHVGSFGIPAGGDCWDLVGDTLVGLMKVGSGIGDEQWDMWTLDLNCDWNGLGLDVHTTALSVVLGDSLRASGKARGEEQGMGDMLAWKRKERLLSLSGRASFPSTRMEGEGLGSSIPIYEKLGYVSVRPWVLKGTVGIVAGFGNRLGVLELDGEGDTLAARMVERRNTGAGTGMGLHIRPPPSRRNTGDVVLKKVN